MEKMNQKKMLAFLFQGVSRCKRVWMWVGGGGGGYKCHVKKD